MDTGSVDSSAIGATEDAAACVHSAFRQPVLVLLEVLAGLTLAEAVDNAAVARQSLLELREPLLDAAAAGGDEIDEQREVVDARVPLGEDVSLDPLKPADDLVGQATDLGEVTGARPEVLAEPVLDRLWQACLEASRRRGEGLDGVPCALQRRVERGRIRATGGGVLDPLLRAGDRVHVHGGDGTTAVGWTFRSWTTSCRRS